MDKKQAEALKELLNKREYKFKKGHWKTENFGYYKTLFHRDSDGSNELKIGVLFYELDQGHQIRISYDAILSNMPQVNICNITFSGEQCSIDDFETNMKMFYEFLKGKPKKQ